MPCLSSSVEACRPRKHREFLHHGRVKDSMTQSSPSLCHESTSETRLKALRRRKNFTSPIALETLLLICVSDIMSHRRRVLLSRVSYVILETCFNFTSPKIVPLLCFSYIVRGTYLISRTLPLWILLIPDFRPQTAENSAGLALPEVAQNLLNKFPPNMGDGSVVYS